MTKRRKKILIVTAAVLAAAVAVCAVGLCLYSVEQNKTIITTSYTVTHPQIPAAFEGKRIVQVTDLHNADFGTSLTETVKAQNPDIIVATGDWMSKEDTDITAGKEQMKALTEIAPVFYVAGNHEAWSPLCAELLIYLDEIGVTILESRAVDWIVDGESVQLVGVFDPEFAMWLQRDLAPLVETDRYSILLFHRPEYIEEVVSLGADLIFSGHSHGGQIRLPFIGPIYAPNQGWFPKYDVGRFLCGEATMIVSQGLGVGTAMRILTPPEVVTVVLDSPL
ncbi:MAG: metallophosphoesterase, partial [Clostridia bacterium]|nr:metallophosphoesterase [Clostridia bacterium]